VDTHDARVNFSGSVEIPDHTFEMGAILNRFSTVIAKGDVYRDTWQGRLEKNCPETIFGSATVAGAKPPRTLVKMRFSTEPFFLNFL